MPDLGLTHVALTARDLDASIAFYGKYAGMAVVHRRVREGVRSVWLSDHTRPFVIVLVEAAGQQEPKFPASWENTGNFRYSLADGTNLDRSAVVTYEEGGAALAFRADTWDNARQMVPAATMGTYRGSPRCVLSAAITIVLCGSLWFVLDFLKSIIGREVALASSAGIFVAAVAAFIFLHVRRRQR